MADRDMVTAAICVIGNEILSGRTQDANIAFLGRNLNLFGIQVREVRVVPDIREEIVAGVNALRARYDYVFTTGGIGPTHDDITAESVAAAFGVEAEYHPVAFAKMAAHYEKTGREFTEARKRMALMPKGAELVEVEMVPAPGFRYDNVFVFAGVPVIAQAMFESAKGRLRRGRTVLSRSISTDLVEGVLAAPLKAIQDRYPQADIGSYPVYSKDSGHGVSLVVRSPDEADLVGAGDEIVAMIADLGGTMRVDERL